MRILLSIATLFLFALLDLRCTFIPRSSELDRHSLGINLSSISFWTPEIVFVDVFKQSHPWTSQAPDKAWNQGGPLPIDEHGWVQKLDDQGQFAETLMFVDLQAHYPAGNYVCLYEGDGELDFAGAGRIVERSAGRMVVHVVPELGPISLRLMKTNPVNPIRNIQIFLPGFEKNGATFHPDFLKRWKDFRVIRFMDWGMTNNSALERWNDRPKLDDASQATAKGVALEYQIQLANELNADAWFCIPHRADDDYVRSFAQLIRSRLKPKLKIYLEFSNECWHGGFEGGRYCAERGGDLHLGSDRYQNELRYYSQRSVEIFRIVESVLQKKDRLVRILGVQPDSPWALQSVLDWKNARSHVDAIAIAPYFGGALGQPQNVQNTSGLSVEEVLAFCRKDIDANAQRTRRLAKMVKGQGLQLLAYEGGQHLVGVEGAQDKDDLTRLFKTVNRDPRLGDLYLRDLSAWEDAGGGLFCIYSSMTKYTQWGSWGVLEYSDQDEKAAPKLQAVRTFMMK